VIKPGLIYKPPTENLERLISLAFDDEQKARRILDIPTATIQAIATDKADSYISIVETIRHYMENKAEPFDLTDITGFKHTLEQWLSNRDISPRERGPVISTYARIRQLPTTPAEFPNLIEWVGKMQERQAEKEALT